MHSEIQTKITHGERISLKSPFSPEIVPKILSYFKIITRKIPQFYFLKYYLMFLFLGCILGRKLNHSLKMPLQLLFQDL